MVLLLVDLLSKFFVLTVLIIFANPKWGHPPRRFDKNADRRPAS